MPFLKATPSLVDQCIYTVSTQVDLVSAHTLEQGNKFVWKFVTRQQTAWDIFGHQYRIGLAQKEFHEFIYIHTLNLHTHESPGTSWVLL